jgi:hypothetical protein
MRTALVEDGHGTRWSVRTRRLRGHGGSSAGPATEPDAWGSQLEDALSPLPARRTDQRTGSPDQLLAPDASDRALAAVRGEIGAPGLHHAGAFEILAAAGHLVADAVRHLRTPLSNRWRVELAARGRIRRWAHWEIAGAESAARAAVAVANDMRAGRVPAPVGALLVEVVDQRPLRWSWPVA